MKVMEDGQRVNRFFTLPLEISKINALTLSWTLLYIINETSPFYNLTREDLMNFNAELLIFLKAYDETFSNFVVSRTSYEASEFIYGGKFKLMYHPSDDKKHTILDISLLSQYDKVDLPDGIYA